MRTYTPSTTTATPAGSTAFVTAIAICLVRRSWTFHKTEKKNIKSTENRRHNKA